MTPSTGDSNPSSYEGTRYLTTALRMYGAKAMAISSTIARALTARLRPDDDRGSV